MRLSSWEQKSCLQKGYLMQGLRNCIQFCQIHPFLCLDAFYFHKHLICLPSWVLATVTTEQGICAIITSIFFFFYNDEYYDCEMMTCVLQDHK